MARQIQKYTHVDKIFAFFEPVGGGETVNLNEVEMVKWSDVAPYINEAQAASTNKQIMPVCPKCGGDIYSGDVG